MSVVSVLLASFVSVSRRFGSSLHLSSSRLWLLAVRALQMLFCLDFSCVSSLHLCCFLSVRGGGDGGGHRGFVACCYSVLCRHPWLCLFDLPCRLLVWCLLKEYAKLWGEFGWKHCTLETKVILADASFVTMLYRVCAECSSSSNISAVVAVETTKPTVCSLYLHQC